MMRATGAKLRMLASEAGLLFALWEGFCGGEADVCGEGDDMSRAAGSPFSRHTESLTGPWGKHSRLIRRRIAAGARLRAMSVSSNAG